MELSRSLSLRGVRLRRMTKQSDPQGHSDPESSSGEESSILVIAGSIKNITKEQIERAERKKLCFVLRLNPQEIFQEKIFKRRKIRWIRFILAKLKNQKNVVVCLKTDPPVAGHSESALGGRRISSRGVTLTRKITQNLGKLTAAIDRSFPLNKLVLLGGQTALEVCRALKIKAVSLEKEILTGIPLTQEIFGDCPDERGTVPVSRRLIVTKPGGFGEKTALITIIKFLERQT